jgi:hypothetical protein
MQEGSVCRGGGAAEVERISAVERGQWGSYGAVGVSTRIPGVHVSGEVWMEVEGALVGGGPHEH